MLTSYALNIQIAKRCMPMPRGSGDDKKWRLSHPYQPFDPSAVEVKLKKTVSLNQTTERQRMRRGVTKQPSAAVFDNFKYSIAVRTVYQYYDATTNARSDRKVINLEYLQCKKGEATNAEHFIATLGKRTPPRRKWDTTWRAKVSVFHPREKVWVPVVYWTDQRVADDKMCKPVKPLRMTGRRGRRISREDIS